MAGRGASLGKRRSRMMSVGGVVILAALTAFAGPGSEARLIGPAAASNREASAPGQNVQSASPIAGGKDSHYLMLVNTAIASTLYPRDLVQFDQSPYDGLAVAFLSNYDDSVPPSIEQMDAKITEWKKYTVKDVWPWVYLNRMIAVNDAQNNPYTKSSLYFHKIRGVDLDAAGGAQTDFIRIWENSLRAARDSQMPGIVCDLEFYNDYRQYDPRELARLSGKQLQQAIDLLEALGARMADAAAAQYPDATLWFLFTGFTHPGYTTPDGQHLFLSSTYISIGLLDEIQKRHLHLKVLSGGESGLGYCHPSVDQFRNQIRERAAGFAPELQKYAGTLDLAGTMALLGDRLPGHARDCDDSSASTIEDLEPYLELLLRSYSYNWIYAAGNNGYFPFRADNAPRFDAMIRKAKAKVASDPPR
jgi:hypothetical protein